MLNVSALGVKVIEKDQKSLKNPKLIFVQDY
jgi:hypothetical protein